MNVGTGRRVLKKLKYQPVSGTKLRGHHDPLLTEISLFIFFISHRGLSAVCGQEANQSTHHLLSFLYSARETHVPRLKLLLPSYLQIIYTTLDLEKKFPITYNDEYLKLALLILIYFRNEKDEFRKGFIRDEYR